jgi:hypothetical protein
VQHTSSCRQTDTSRCSTIFCRQTRPGCYRTEPTQAAQAILRTDTSRDRVCMYVCIPQDRANPFLHAVVRIGTTHPVTRRRACPPFVSARGHTCLRERGGPNSDEGTETVVPLCGGNSLFTMYVYTRSGFCSQQCCKRPVKFHTLDGTGYF